MPGQSNTNSTPSPFEITTSPKSKKGGNKGIVVATLIVVFLILSVVAGILLVQQNQNVQEKAAPSITADKCATGYVKTHLHECKKNCQNEQTVGDPWYWINSTKGANCGTGTDGSPKYWCDIDECNKSSAATASPTASAKATATASPKASATATATSTATSTATATATATANSNPQATVNVGTGTPTSTATATTAATAQTTSKPIPVTGVEWPTIAGVGLGIMVIVGSILLAL